MKKLLLSLCLMATFCSFLLNAEKKMSPSTQNFLRSYESTSTISQRAKLKSTYAINQNNGEMAVSAFLHLVDENNLDGLEENQVIINAQYGTILSTSIPADNLISVSQLPSVKYIEIGRPVHQRMNNVRSEQFSNVNKIHEGTGLTQAYTGKDVIVGIIDGGFQYNHINFYDTEGKNLRIKRVWNQNLSGTPPTGYYYGTEYTNAEEIIAAKQDYAASHATHVTGIAAGAYKGNKYYGIAPDADLVLVSYNISDNSSSNTSITDGIKYIYDYAESVGKPCVINMSLGYHIGPHDGTSTFDRICDQLQGEGRLLVGASGNEGDYNMHAKKTLTPQSPSMKTLLSINLQAITLPFIDIWGDANKDFNIRLFVYDISNHTEVYSSNRFSTAEHTSQTITNPSGKIFGNIRLATATDPNNKKGNITIDLDLYASQQLNYYIGFEITSSEDNTINAWTDGSNTSFINNYDGFDHGDNNSTMGEIGGTGKRIITVGAYTSCNYIDHKNSSMWNNSGQTLNQLVSFSSLGPTADGRTKPDITAPGSMLISSFNSSTSSNRKGEDYNSVVKQENVNAVNYYYGSMEGTSMATPVVTGILATWLQANPKLTPEQVREILSNTATTDSYTGNIAGVGNNRWGYGKINAYDGLVYCLNHSGIEQIGTPTRPMVYPNPATDICYFLLQNDDKNVNVSIYTLNGTEICSRYMGNINAGEQNQLELSDLAAGIYFLHITGDKTNMTTKLTVK